MKAYRRVSIALLLNLALFIMIDIWGFLHGVFSLNLYPILPFNAYPSISRGTQTYDMWHIIVRGDYSNTCATIGAYAQSSPEVDSLCIYSISQYAWKKDSLLMEVVLQDESKQWIMASPLQKSHLIKCQLNLVPTPTDKELSAYHRIQLDNSELREFIKKLNLNDSALLHLTLGVIITYGLLLLSIPVLWILSIILGIIQYSRTTKENGNIYRNITYIIIPLIPLIVIILLRIFKFTMLF